MTTSIPSLKQSVTLRAIAFCMFAAANASAATVTIVDATFARSEVDLQRFDGSKLTGSTPRGSVELSARDIVLIERPAFRAAADSKSLQLVLRNGERLTGAATAFANDSVTWTTSLLGPRDVPLAQIEEVVHAGEKDAITLSADEMTRDVLLLSNGDRAGGIITAMDDKAVTVQPADGQPLLVEWASIRRIHLAAAGDVPQAKASWRVSLVDATVCDVEKIEIDKQSVLLHSGQQQSKVSIEQVHSIENLAGKARLLTRVPPIKREYAPFFPRSTNQQTMEVPEEVAVGDARTRLFIPVRPHSRLTWNIDGGATLFKTRFIVGSTGNMANCQARIWLDDRKVFDQANLTSSSALGTFETPVGAAKTVTLEVDFGENFDVQDQFYWVEPALVGE